MVTDYFLLKGVHVSGQMCGRAVPLAIPPDCDESMLLLMIGAGHYDYWGGFAIFGGGDIPSVFGPS